jgi:methylated-DNA-[protein]-cysteine S-methyltransferase
LTTTASAAGAPVNEARREAFFRTPYGLGRVVLRGDQPVALDIPDPSRRRPAGAALDDGRWCELLSRYFCGEPVVFPLDIEAYVEQLGCTAFETDVLRALARIPYGRTVSYRDLACDAGHPTAWRATGSVMARNELPVILPCHRVTRSDGRLGNYGDDPSWKRRLLELEGAPVVASALARGGGAPARPIPNSGEERP